MLTQAGEQNNNYAIIQGTLEDPLFQANQIKKLLGVVNMRDGIKDFSENEKVVFLTDTLGGKQEIHHALI